MRVVGYLRASTEEQADSGLGLAAQRAAIEAEARRRGWELVSVYEDAGVSAKAITKLRARENALEAVSSHQANALVVSRLDRFSRSLLDFADVMARATREGWAFVALDLSVDTSTAAGEMLAHVMASFAQYERRLIAERTKAALKAAKARGTHVGRPVSTPKNIEQLIVEARRSGVSYWAIRKRFETEGIPTSRGGRWHISTIQKIIKRNE
jgi:DNA invertase Pin-like site-specific DNA recombinase